MTNAARAAPARLPQRYLTKSLFQKACECPRKLAYASSSLRSSAPSSKTPYFPTQQSLSGGNKFMQSLAKDGQKVGAYSRLLFPQGVEIGQNHNNSNSNNNNNTQATMEELVQQTQSLLLDSNKNTTMDLSATTLFEGAVRFGPYLIRADILHKPPLPTIDDNTNSDTIHKNKELHLYEVKSKSWDSRKDRNQVLLGKRGGSVKANYLPYIRDVAFQKMVVQQAFPDFKVVAFLLLPDKAKVNTLIPNLNGLFQEVVADVESTSPSTATRIQLNSEARDPILQSNECLMTMVDVDDVVDMVLKQELTFPGNSHGQTFEEAAADWANRIIIPSDDCNDSNKDNNNGSILSNMYPSPPPIGNHCSGCEYRLAQATGGGGSTSNSMYNRKNQSGKEEQYYSGFAACWEEASGLTAGSFDANSAFRPVSDLFYGGKSVNRFLSDQKYLLSDVTSQDLGLMPLQSGKDGDGKVVMGSIDKKKSSSSIPKENSGMSRAVRQWHQVTHEGGGHQSPSLSRESIDETEMENRRQDKDYSAATTPVVILDKDYLREKMDTWQFPFHFVDFETAVPALPYSVGRAPFDLLAFQFSHHVLYESGHVEHATQFLHAKPGKCPNEAFLTALSAAIGNCQGTVFRWGAHENTVLSAILAQQQQHPKSHHPHGSLSLHLEPLLTGGSRPMVDLMQIATKGYYIGGSGASVSIKKLLLPTMCASSRLRDVYGQPTYSSSNFIDMQWWQQQEKGDTTQEGHGLQVSDDIALQDPYSLLTLEEDKKGALLPETVTAVADGGEAIVAYDTLQSSNLDPVVRASLEASLLRYCELDTLAMAMIVQAWQGFLDET